MPSFQTNCLRKFSLRPFQSLALITFLAWNTGTALCQGGKTTARAVSDNNARLISAVPMAFEENDGQLAPGFSFLGRAQSYSVAIAPEGLRFVMPGSAPGSAVNLRFAGSHGGFPVSLSGVTYRSNYFIGPDPSKWHEGIANFSRIGLRKVYPGIDTEFYEKN